MITTYQANKENDIMFGKRNTVVLDTLYIGLSHSAITSSGTGQTEPNDQNYRRLTIANDTANFLASSNGIIKNNVDWEFPISSKAWNNITHWFIADREVGGNILYYDTLPSAMSVDIHQILIFKRNMIQIKRSGV